MEELSPEEVYSYNPTGESPAMISDYPNFSKTRTYAGSSSSSARAVREGLPTAKDTVGEW